MSYFQYIEVLYIDNELQDTDMLDDLDDWLDSSIGSENNTRTEKITTWGWSLTNISNLRFTPVGIYFAYNEDRSIFRLKFGIVSGRSRDID